MIIWKPDFCSCAVGFPNKEKENYQTIRTCRFHGNLEAQAHFSKLLEESRRKENAKDEFPQEYRNKIRVHFNENRDCILTLPPELSEVDIQKYKAIIEVKHPNVFVE